MTRREEIEIKALSEYRIKEKENKKATGTYDANLPRRKAFIEGAEWADKTMIDKATQWLFENVYDYLNPEDQERVESFRKYLEE
jgi:hypothetical protein